MTTPLRRIPAVNEILAHPAIGRLEREHPRQLLVHAIRTELDDYRRGLAGGNGQELSLDWLADQVAVRLRHELQPKLRPVINATGIVLHTNLGRAPMAEEAAEAAADAARGYLNLELDLATGQRSSRQDAVRDWLCRLLGSEAATAVNNNAAATVIALRAVAMGKEVIASRGELVEIGGSFRIPDIMRVSGAVLREVGTTNMTRIRDYEAAITSETAALLRVHCSNYRIVGHTESASLEEMVALARKRNLIVIDDIGSGALVDFRRWGLSDEPLARDSLAAGADLVLFSGDKLLGGPQAGILAGRREVIQKIEKDPLMRAFRLDKMTLAALEATLRLYLDPERVYASIPILRMLEQTVDQLRQRAEGLQERLRGTPGLKEVRIIDDFAYVGGGSLPDQRMPTVVLALKAEHYSETQLAERLRTGNPAVMPRVQDGTVMVDVRTVFAEQEDELITACQAALSG